MSYNIVVEKSTGRIGIQVKDNFFESTIDVLIKAATENNMAELTCDFKKNWEPFKNGEHYNRIETDNVMRNKKGEPIRYTLDNDREENEKFLRGDAL